MDSNSELPQPSQNPEQGPKDPRITKVIQELSESARLLADPRLLNLKANPDEGKNSIRYLSADNSIYVELWKADIMNTNPANLPKAIEYKEKIIPLNCGSWEIAPGAEGGFYNHVWLTLDPDTPKVYELLDEGGYRSFHTRRITGNEVVKERPKLLPHILKAVTGKKAAYKGRSDKPAEWKDTFDTE